MKKRLLIFGILIVIMTMNASALKYNVESYSDDTYSTIKDNFVQGETVYAKATKSGGWVPVYMKIKYYDPDGTLVKTCASTKRVWTYTCDYTLPSNAKTGKWKIKLYASYSGYWYLKKDVDHFNVSALPPASEFSSLMIAAAILLSSPAFAYLIAMKKRH